MDYPLSRVMTDRKEYRDCFGGSLAVTEREQDYRNCFANTRKDDGGMPSVLSAQYLVSSIQFLSLRLSGVRVLVLYG